MCGISVFHILKEFFFFAINLLLSVIKYFESYLVPVDCFFPYDEDFKIYLFS